MGMETIDLSAPGGKDEFRRARGELVPAKPANRKVSKADRASLEDAFVSAWLAVGHGLPLPKPQYRFHKKRKWRFDFAFPDFKVAVEIQGGQWCNGAHNRGAGQAKDHEKLNAAAADGWHVFQFATSRMSDPYKVAAEVAEVLRSRQV